MLLLFLLVNSGIINSQSLCLHKTDGDQVLINYQNTMRITFSGDDLLMSIDGLLQPSINFNTINSIIFPENILRLNSQTQERGNFIIFHNPEKEQLTVYSKYANAVNVLILIVGIDGKIVQQRNSRVQSNNSITIDIQGLKQGAYICRLVSGNSAESLKFIK